MTFSNPFHARYGRDDIPLPDQQPNSFTENLLKRTSCRNFLPTPLPNGTLELLIAAAQSAPSSGMLQTWSVISLDQKDRENFTSELWKTPGRAGILGNIDTANYTAIGTAKIFLIWLADLSKLDFILQNNNNIDEEIKSATNTAEYHLKAVVDATIAAQTLFMTAESMGISGTYMGAIRQLPATFLQDTFNLPKYTFPLFGMAIGYPAMQILSRLPTPPLASPRPRLTQDFILHHSTYKPMSSLSELKDYNTVHQKIGRRGVSNFESRVVERLDPSETKQRTGEFLKQMGFGFE
jgi:nitroreductase